MDASACSRDQLNLSKKTYSQSCFLGQPVSAVITDICTLLFLKASAEADVTVDLLTRPSQLRGQWEERVARLLILEDERVLARHIQNTLERAGYAVASSCTVNKDARTHTQQCRSPGAGSLYKGGPIQLQGGSQARRRDVSSPVLKASSTPREYDPKHERRASHETAQIFQSKGRSVNLIVAIIIIALNPAPFWVCGASGAGHPPACHETAI